MLRDIGERNNKYRERRVEEDEEHREKLRQLNRQQEELEEGRYETEDTHTHPVATLLSHHGPHKAHIRRHLTFPHPLEEGEGGVGVLQSPVQMDVLSVEHLTTGFAIALTTKRSVTLSHRQVEACTNQEGGVTHRLKGTWPHLAPRTTCPPGNREALSPGTHFPRPIP
ncbi:unnamed protein product [Pleuronectes platessa]|uniref:Uncharacterized protein n=1 Tax=Pleuronectes platessa TaxID=8262 RepID=A0A9N7Z717_PLEPL|nr:unnamed protein product [Pleuronectes platessa]